MLPDHYVCRSCLERFEFKFREVRHCVGTAPIDKQVAEKELLWTPVRPAWCNDCESVCLVEDIASLRAFEDAYGAVRSGRPVEYPIGTEFMDPKEAEKAVEPYLRWRMERRHAARALCCGGSNFQFMDVAQPLLKHAECDFGFIGPMFSISSYCGSGPGVLSPANIRLYSSEGELIGLLTWYHREEDKWDVVAANYPPAIDE